MDFRTFLDTHENFLIGIGNLIVTEHGNYWVRSEAKGNVENTIENGVVAKTSLDPEYFNKNCITGDQTWAIKNMRNSWYHQAALLYPGSTDKRMKFAVWKVVQFYYSIFAALSAVVRVKDGRVDSKHVSIINVFQNNFIENSRLSGKVFHPPFTTYIDESDDIQNDCRSKENIKWDYGRGTHAENIKKCLEWTKEETKTVPTNLFRYFWCLRNWINYEDPSLFSKLYGITVKRNIDSNLLSIMYSFGSMADCYLVGAIGKDRILKEYNKFMDEFEDNLGIDLMFLKNRRDAIKSFL